MKPFVVIASLFIITLFTSFIKSSEYDVVAFYTGIEAQEETKALVNDEIQETSLILVNTKLNAGKYLIKVKRITRNLYRIVGKDVYIETRFCYEYPSGEDVIFIVNSSSAYNKGKIIF